MLQDCDYDIAIIGGGMAGASLACYLAQQSRDQLKIALIEKYPYPEQEQALYQPSFDARSTALSFGSRLIYEDMQIWPLLAQHVNPIDEILVSDKGHWSQTRMKASEHKLEALGYVVENAWLGRVLLQRLNDFQQIDILAPAEVSTLKPGASEAGSFACLTLSDGVQIKADLAVIADGVDSPLAAQLGMQTQVQDYGQQALICNVGFKRPHNNCAYERFTEQGPMALLPLPPEQNTAPAEELPRSALVWCLDPDQAQRLQNCDEAEFCQALQQQFGYRQGQFSKVGKRILHPLRLTLAQEQVRHNILVLGNAAHTLHPVAGQGYNLVLRDIACLTRLLLRDWAQTQRIKSRLDELLPYLEQQIDDQKQTVYFSDLLPKVFQQSLVPVQLARGLGLLALDLSPNLQHNFVRFAAGMAGKRHNSTTRDLEKV